MTLDDVLDEWDKDAPIDRLELGNDSIAISRLHAKWLRNLTRERLRLRKRESEMKTLRLAKFEFYTQGPTKETQELGWEFPARGIILNKDVSLYMEADKQIIEKNLEIAYQAEVVAAIDLIFVALKARGFDIGRKLDWMKLQAG